MLPVKITESQRWLCWTDTLCGSCVHRWASKANASTLALCVAADKVKWKSRFGKNNQRTKIWSQSSKLQRNYGYLGRVLACYNDDIWYVLNCSSSVRRKQGIFYFIIFFPLCFCRSSLCVVSLFVHPLQADLWTYPGVWVLGIVCPLGIGPRKRDSVQADGSLYCSSCHLVSAWLWSIHLISGRFSSPFCNITIICTFRFILGLYAPLFDYFSRCQHRSRYGAS